MRTQKPAVDDRETRRGWFKSRSRRTRSAGLKTRLYIAHVTAGLKTRLYRRTRCGIMSLVTTVEAGLQTRRQVRRENLSTSTGRQTSGASSLDSPIRN
jgi:hypothetical protein